MAYLTETEVRNRAANITQKVQKSAGRILDEVYVPDNQIFDVFLSYSSAESEDILLGVKAMLEERELSVYIDKYNDPQLTPESVTPETAEILRRRMQNSKALLYVYSQNSKKSRWMPWELGYFDGLKGTVGIIPVTRNQETTFKGEEYLNLYPYVDIATITGTNKPQLWINKSANTYAQLANWVKGSETIRSR